MVSTDSCLAVSINEQVFTTMTSASSAREVIWAPPLCNMPIMTSLSTRFLGQPKLTKPTFTGLDSATGCSGARVMVGFSTDIHLQLYRITVQACTMPTSKFPYIPSANTRRRSMEDNLKNQSKKRISSWKWALLARSEERRVGKEYRER